MLEGVNYISCDLYLNVISEFNILAFFYPSYPGKYKFIILLFFFYFLIFFLF